MANMEASKFPDDPMESLLVEYGNNLQRERFELVLEKNALHAARVGYQDSKLVNSRHINEIDDRIKEIDSELEALGMKPPEFEELH
jgi:hypothetical protein